MKNKVLALSAAAEAGTGLLLLAWPSLVVRLLFGADISGIGVVMSRIAGIALIGLCGLLALQLCLPAAERNADV